MGRVYFSQYIRIRKSMIQQKLAICQQCMLIIGIIIGIIMIMIKFSLIPLISMQSLRSRGHRELVSSLHHQKHCYHHHCIIKKNFITPSKTLSSSSFHHHNFIIKIISIISPVGANNNNVESPLTLYFLVGFIPGLYRGRCWIRCPPN